ncbi:MAG: hypothetical protein ACI4EV_06545 [Lachnospiraceae bacterium]
MLNIFGGVRIYDFSNKNLNFDIPKEYLILTLVIALIGLRYISSDYSRNTAVIFGNRKKWIAGKMISNSIIILIVYVTGIFIAGIFSGFSLGFNKIADQKIFKIDTVPDSIKDVVLTIACCVLTALAISMLQLLISVMSNYFTGFIVAMGIYVVSVFDCNPFLLGNGIMFIRYGIFSENGNPMLIYLISSSLIIVVGAVATLAVVKKKDIL